MRLIKISLLTFSSHSLCLPLLSPSHCLSSFSQAFFMSLCWQVLAGRFGGRGQINTQSNSCQMRSSVCASACVQSVDLLAWYCIHYSFLPFFLPHIYQPAVSFYLMRVSMRTQLIFTMTMNWIRRARRTLGFYYPCHCRCCKFNMVCSLC